MTSIALPPRVSLARLPTPFHPLDRISEALKGPRIWLKRDDLTGTVLSGNKIRKLEFVVAQALADGCDVLITCGGVQSNHCRATALVGAQLGLQVRLILRADSEYTRPDGNLLLDYLAGADVRVFSAPHYREALPALLAHAMEECRQRGLKPFLIPTGASDEIGVWGYLAACEELKTDFAEHDISPRKIFVATGSGGTQAGLTIGSALHGLGAEVVGIAVCDSAKYFQEKVAADLGSWQARYRIDCDLQQLAVSVNADYIGPGYAKATQAVFETIRWVAQREGVIFDPIYTGKAFDGLVNEIKQGRLAAETDVVFIHTGGLFGIFAQKEQMLA